jgi:hypothetical protein
MEGAKGKGLYIISGPEIIPTENVSRLQYYSLRKRGGGGDHCEPYDVTAHRVGGER